MPRILEIKKIDGHIWARLDVLDEPSPVYVWTEGEAKREWASAIRTFCFALANRYIEDPINGLVEAQDAQPE